MAIFYKLFRLARTVFSYSFLALTICGGYSAAHAAPELFTVDKVEIDVSAENAIAAREKAFEDAQQAAFQKLAERMLSESELDGFTMPEGLQLSTMIQDYEVSNEKLSAKRYSATYKFRFKDEDVRRFFSGRGMSYTDMASRPLLILPFQERTDGRGTMLWSPYNEWMRAWMDAPLDNGLVPLVVPIGDLMDVNDIGDDEALSYNPRRLNSMISRYNTSEAVIAIAKPQAASGQIEVQIYRTDRQSAEYVQQIMQPIPAGGNMGAAYREAVEKVKAALRKDWKSKTVYSYAQDAPGQFIQVRVRFVSLQEWTKIKTRLKGVQPVTQMDLKALSPKEAYVDLYYAGDLQRLNLAMRQAGMRLEGSAPQVGPGSLNGAGASVYDLVYDRYGAVSPYADPYSSYSSAPPSAPSAYTAQPEYEAQTDDDVWADRRRGAYYFAPEPMADNAVSESLDGGVQDLPPLEQGQGADWAQKQTAPRGSRPAPTPSSYSAEF